VRATVRKGFALVNGVRWPITDHSLDGRAMLAIRHDDLIASDSGAEGTIVGCYTARDGAYVRVRYDEGDVVAKMDGALGTQVRLVPSGSLAAFSA